ncbi:MAG: glycosyltransferase family 2 protein [Bacteroides sp.]|nr:glycosyltransferase family 2 protein [Bacteroides sp.]
MDISVILPSYNPTEKLVTAVQELSEAGFDDIIVINDGSEKTEIFDRISDLPFVTVITHEKNKGKGRALKTGFEYFLENRRDKLGAVTTDDDMQHRTEDITACCDEMKKTGIAVFGARSFKGEDIPPKSRIGNNITSFTFRFLCGIKISDTQTGLRAVPKSYIPVFLKTDGERFEYETNMLLSMKENGLTFKEIPIKTIYADNNSGTHFRPVRDSVKIYAVILKYIASSLTSSAIDLIFFTLLNLLLPKSWDEHLRIFASTAAARAVSSAVNFTVNRRRVFKSKSKLKKSLLKYYTLTVCQTLASYGLVYLITCAAGTSQSIFQTLYKMAVDLFLFFICFVVQREWVFKERTL